ncbi:MAG: S41 family peptidase [Phycisphaeraceae bacterium]|nr:S41 family peptidase [Phycisphaeraceae bacterium]
MTFHNKTASNPWVRVATYVILAGALLVIVSETVARRGGVFDQLDLLVDVRHQIVGGYVEKPDEKKMMESAVRGMVESLNDPFTIYIPPDDLPQFTKAISGTFVGIGAEVDTFQNRVRIVSPLEESPAWKAGVMAGDILLEINGQSTLNMKINDAITKLQGEEGSIVKVKVRHDTGEEVDLTITRARINVQTVKGFRRNGDSHWEFMIDESNKIGYIRILQFTDKTASELKAALDRLTAAGVKGLILDVRFNPGGLLQSAVDVSNMFLDKGKRIVSVKGRIVPESVEYANGQGEIPPIPMVVIANEASASAAEVVTGALSDNNRAVFIGTRTFGKGSVQQVYPLDNELGALKMTNAYYYLPNGRNIHRRENSETWGVDPADGYYVLMAPNEIKTMIEIRRDSDVLRKGNGKSEASVTPEWIKTKLADPQLAAALQAVQGKLLTGVWPKVGESGAAQLAKRTKHDNLQRQREQLAQRLDEIDAELDKLDGNIATTRPTAGNTTIDTHDFEENSSLLSAPEGTSNADKEKNKIPPEILPATQPHSK